MELVEFRNDVEASEEFDSSEDWLMIDDLFPSSEETGNPPNLRREDNKTWSAWAPLYKVRRQSIRVDEDSRDVRCWD